MATPLQAEVVLTDAQLAATIVRRRTAIPRLYPRMFAQQRAFRDDPARRKAALCTRRAGKTEGIACSLLDDLIDFPNQHQLYLALTHRSAKQILWNKLRELTVGRTDLQFNVADLTVTADNGAILYVAGADDDSDIEKRRGMKLRRVVVDEAASFGARLAYIVDEVLEPATMDLLGTIELIGTPGAACIGLFHDVTCGLRKGWSVHTWSVLDNPHVPHAAQELARMRAEHGWTDETPAYLREWCARWTRDDFSLVYAFDALRNVGPSPDKLRTWQHILGVDLGFEDATAFNVASFRYGAPNVHMHSAEKRSKMDVSAIAERIQAYRTQYTFAAIVMDTAGLGRMVAEEMKTRFDLPIEAAEKTDKLSIIELLNSDLRTGRVTLEPKHPAIDEMNVMQWNAKRTREAEGYAADASDALLYSYRHSRHWTFRPAAEEPPKGTPERANVEAERHFEQTAKTVETGQAREWWEDG